MNDDPPRRVEVITPGRLKALRWSMQFARSRGEIICPVDLIELSAIVDLAEEGMLARTKTAGMVQ